ncbi:chemotaxis protein CheW [Lysobacter sp. Hz 25]|uniref:chemotaxis protein CheW n=1 Tax=Lysobacter sp. Hz 25 TaxID=3383698 RepID=UPI0038D3D4B7
MSAKHTPAGSSSAVARLLDRAPEPEALREATRHVAAKAEDLRSLTGSLFVFRLGAEWLGLAASVVDEVIEPRPVHTLPHRREGVVRGLVNVRGQLTVCVALEALFHLEPGHAEAARSVLNRRLVVLAWQEQRLAFEADEVHGSHRYDPATIGNVPATVAHSVSPFSTGILAMGQRNVGVLDDALVLSALNRRLG